MWLERKRLETGRREGGRGGKNGLRGGGEGRAARGGGEYELK